MADLVWLTTDNLQLSQQASAILLVKIRQLEIEYRPGAEDEVLKKEYAYVIQLFQEHGDINNKITKFTMRIYKRERLTEDPSYYRLPEYYDIEQAELASITSALAALSTSIEDTSMLLREPDKYNLKGRIWCSKWNWTPSLKKMMVGREEYPDLKRTIESNYVEQLELQLREQDNKMSELEHSNALLMEGNTAAVELVESLETQLAKVREETYELEIKYKKGQRLYAYRRENGRLTTELHDLQVAAGSSNRAARNPDDSGPSRASRSTDNATATDPNAWLERDLEEDNDSDQARPRIPAGPGRDAKPRRPGHYWREGTLCKFPKKNRAKKGGS